MNERKLTFGIGLFLLSMFFISMAFTSMAIVTSVPLKDRVQFGTYSYSACDSSLDTDDYMIVGTHWYSTMGETIWCSDGETSAGVGTSYLDLSGSCIIGVIKNCGFLSQRICI